MENQNKKLEEQNKKLEDQNNKLEKCVNKLEIRVKYLEENSNINEVKKAQSGYVYIATSKSWEDNTRFKIGRVKSKFHLKSRLSTYNVGRIKDIDEFYFVHTIESDNECFLEKKILDKFSDYRIKGTEIIQTDLESLLTYVKEVV